ncbi:GH32 C-terminal domain-containing protein [Bacteroides sp. ET336]|uniref:GH32 C-terminal domain-containing protein n=1 Tax=Bacteroides sp. ET336 TaxID=2972459 RepID=UPI0021AC3BEA|nr:GH32 C-terminal domain-containing protein [Bacteroides sp. ET336]MCR8894003.1 GH32 C-terminal domain-containing protein [Bacteroides sp. ET336]MDN0058500.1 GH32 C-terminal domain-containing protein [Bacteroides caecigallinarum]
MKITTLCMSLVFSLGIQDANSAIRVKNLGNENNFVYINPEKKYLLIPVEDSAPEGEIDFVYQNSSLTGYTQKVRLSRGKTDYYVPVDMSQFDKDSIIMIVRGVPSNSICWSDIEESDDMSLEVEKYRPSYHHTPAYGWMNDPNGMFYKDGVYHLYFQYNPYGSMWGNMHWGHSTSTDLVNWKNEGVAIAPDAIGTIFSGSCVVDHNNTSGFGEGAVVAFYTSAKQTPWGDCQTQSMAYSLDNGKTFIKYENNPILTSSEKDFRDPKVFWYAPKEHWVMMLAVGQHMEIYSSKNLKDWTKESEFGEGHGCHGGVWECPDLVELPVEGTKEKKWVLICNINPGGPFGGSATQYFVGDFDGSTFTNNYPEETKWMDYGKDHYATVTWNNAPDGRCIAIGWMSNWQYANNVPTLQYRSANTIARDLSLFKQDGSIFLKSEPCKEMLEARKDGRQIKTVNVAKAETISLSPQSDNGTYEVELSINPGKSKEVSFVLSNGKGEKVLMTYDVLKKTFAIDRTKSGEVSFSNDFPAVTEMSLSKSKELKLRLFVDKSSIEAFVDNGKFVMTNCVFPSVPYDMIRFESDGNRYKVKNINIYQIK